ncbi:MAG: type 4a pilus biogenesis protein PilO [Candidatus Gracilibacteria bacterium]
MSSDKVSIFGQIKNLICCGQRKAGFFIAQFCVILVVGIIAVVLMRGWLVGISGKIFESQSEINTYQQRFGAFNQLRQNYQSVEKDLSTLYNLLPREDAIGDIVTQIDALMNKQGLNGSIKIGMAAGGGSAFIPVTLDVKASLDMLKFFFIELDKMPFISGVKSINFGGGLNSIPNATISMIIYIR